MADDLPLTIPWKSIVDFFNCPVCMCRLQNTHITPCGHRYCEKCIRECVDRHHKCPCCNNALKQKHLIKDHQFDDLFAETNRHKEESEKKYFDSLIETASQLNSTNREEPMTRILSPVEAVLKEHLKNSLASHERYYQELKKEFNTRKNKLEEEYVDKKEELFQQGLSAIDIEQRLSILEVDTARQRQMLEDDMDRCGQLVAGAFDKYLSEHIPNMNILPIPVTLCLLKKSIQIHDIHIKPHDSLDDIKILIRNYMESKGDRIVEFDERIKFLCFGPLARRTLYEMNRMAHDVVELGATHSDIFILPDHCRPILQYQMKPGSEIAVYGCIKCDSDMPKQCFVTVFDTDKSLVVDYFHCKDCSLKWICRSCVESCHKDHNVVPYIMNHKPTWACCYCSKKKKCSLIE